MWWNIALIQVIKQCNNAVFTFIRELVIIYRGVIICLKHAISVILLSIFIQQLCFTSLFTAQQSQVVGYDWRLSLVLTALHALTNKVTVCHMNKYRAELLIGWNAVKVTPCMMDESASARAARMNKSHTKCTPAYIPFLASGGAKVPQSGGLPAQDADEQPFAFNNKVVKNTN